MPAIPFTKIEVGKFCIMKNRFWQKNRCPNYIFVVFFVSGTKCLARFPVDGDYYRASVIDMLHLNDDPPRVTVSKFYIV